MRTDPPVALQRPCPAVPIPNQLKPGQARRYLDRGNRACNAMLKLVNMYATPSLRMIERRTERPLSDVIHRMRIEKMPPESTK